MGRLLILRSDWNWMSSCRRHQFEFIFVFESKIGLLQSFKSFCMIRYWSIWIFDKYVERIPITEHMDDIYSSWLNALRMSILQLESFDALLLGLAGEKLVDWFLFGCNCICEISRCDRFIDKRKNQTSLNAFMYGCEWKYVMQWCI